MIDGCHDFSEIRIDYFEHEEHAGLHNGLHRAFNYQPPQMQCTNLPCSACPSISRMLKIHWVILGVIVVTAEQLGYAS